VANTFYTNNVLAQNPFFSLSTKVANIYGDAIRKNLEELTVSSTKIVQEQAIQAWTNAAQSCTKALVQNAMSHHQQALDRIAKANQRVFEVFTTNFTSLNFQN
jgi:hypothetical protein